MISSTVNTPRSASVIDPSLPAPRGTADEHVLGQYIPLLYHYHLLQDEARVTAFREAIEQHVHPGMHVVELGGGTGILSSLAARRGARVSCVEHNPELVDVARRLIRDNGIQRRVTVIHADATEYVPDSPVDVVVCEMLHVGLLREKQAQVLAAFKRRYVHAYGRKLPKFLPEASILMAQLVQQSFDFAGYHAPVPMFQSAQPDQARTRELSPLSPYANIAYDDVIPMWFDVRQSVPTDRSGTVNAIRLVTQNVIAIDVPRQMATTWPNQCLVLPIDTPFDVDRGQTVQLKFAYAAGGSVEQLVRSIEASPQPQLPANADQAARVA